MLSPGCVYWIDSFLLLPIFDYISVRVSAPWQVTIGDVVEYGIEYFGGVIYFIEVILVLIGSNSVFRLRPLFRYTVFFLSIALHNPGITDVFSSSSSTY
jgi:hypothetical protein